MRKKFSKIILLATLSVGMLSATYANFDINTIKLFPGQNSLMPEDIKLEYFAKRRAELLEQAAPNSIILIPGASEAVRANDTTFDFRQNGDFFYLTGFNEPDSFAVLVKDSESNKFIMFVRPRDPLREQWEGKRAGTEGAVTKYWADESYEINDLDQIILELMKNKSTLYYEYNANKDFDKKIQAWLTQMDSPPEVKNVSNMLTEMRVIKDDYELELLAKASKISAAAHVRAMQAAKQATHEYELEAEITHEATRYGAKQSYLPIVGSGGNSCILHYNENDSIIDKNSVILIDAAAEYMNYASDVTRTFPASGKFSAEQRAIYDLVLKAQLAAIATVKPGGLWSDAQKVILEILTQGLVDLDIIKANGKSIAELIRDRAYAPFYMHSSGHFVGIDVHDTSNYKSNGHDPVYQPNMVLTVEPGIYIKEGLPVDKKWWNIGVRIEDVLLVTAQGHLNLTVDAPKTVEEIEQLMNK